MDKKVIIVLWDELGIQSSERKRKVTKVSWPHGYSSRSTKMLINYKVMLAISFSKLFHNLMVARKKTCMN